MLHVLLLTDSSYPKGCYMIWGMGLHLGTLLQTCRYNWAVEIEAEKMFPQFSFVPPTCRQRQTNCSFNEEYLALGTRSQQKDANHHENCVSLVPIQGNAQRTQANGKMTKMNLNFVVCQNQCAFSSQHIVKVFWENLLIWHSFVGFEQRSYTWYIDFCYGVHKVSTSLD
jgi:hypothetical protein